MGLRIAVVALGEVAVERSDDGVRFVVPVAVARPLTDARPTSIGQHDSADTFEILEDTVALDRVTHLLGTGCDGELRLGLDVLFLGLASNGRQLVSIVTGGFSSSFET